MKQQVEAIRDKALGALEQLADSRALEQWRVEYLGKKGELTALLRGMGQVDPQQRPVVGQWINQTREALEQALEMRAQSILASEQQSRLQAEAIDVTLPGTPKKIGRAHVLTSVQRKMEDIFIAMGFSVVEGPEVEYDHYNFELMNIPKNHPSRDMQDSFFFNENLLLRTHTSPVQARVMLSQKPPIRIVCPGRVYRVDEVDSTHSPMFHQMEGLVVDKGITMADLRGTLDAYAHAFFGDQVKTRLRPSYFPFTEPSAELDVSCAVCGGEGCPTCHGAGWIEVLGCGMVNHKVLRMCGIDPEEYSGFAFGMGIDRMAIIKYGITDMRLIFENDVRFTRQF